MMRTPYITFVVSIVIALANTGSAFLSPASTPMTTSTTSTSLDAVVDRRNWVCSTVATATAVIASNIGLIAPANAEEEVAIAAEVPKTEMKDFVDPLGLFSIRVPKNFFTLRRTVKGDLPDDKTGKGRRGSSIFTAGNMAKAEVIAIERCVLALIS